MRKTADVGPVATRAAKGSITQGEGTCGKMEEGCFKETDGHRALVLADTERERAEKEA